MHQVFLLEGVQPPLYISILAKAGRLAEFPTRPKLTSVTVSETSVKAAIITKLLREFTWLTNRLVTVELVEELTEPTVFTYVTFLAK